MRTRAGGQREALRAAQEIDASGRYPSEHIPALVESGLAGLFVPKEFGAQGAPLVTTCAVMEELAHGCATTASLFAACILGSYPILLAGSDAQKDSYLWLSHRHQGAVRDDRTGNLVEAGADLAEALHTQFAVRATVEALPYGSLPRTEHKAKWVIHE